MVASHGEILVDDLASAIDGYRVVSVFSRVAKPRVYRPSDAAPTADCDAIVAVTPIVRQTAQNPRSLDGQSIRA